MAQVTVTIAGKNYRIACGDGEERHLEGLASSFDARVEDMRAAFGEIGDMRLHVMAAISLADEMHETKRRMAALEAELEELKAFTATGVHRMEVQLAETVHRTAERLEHLARSLNPGQG